MSERLALGDWILLATETWLWGAPTAIAAYYTSTQTHPVPTLIGAAITLIFAWLAFWRVRHVLRGDIWQSRLEFTRALRQMPDQVPCLDRDGHAVFYRSSMRSLGMPVTMCTRIDEDDAVEFAHKDEGEEVLTGTEYRMTPVVMRIISRPTGVKLALRGGDVSVPPEPARSMRDRVRGNVGLQRMLAKGYLWADPSELRELAARIRIAEPLRSDGDSGR